MSFAGSSDSASRTQLGRGAEFRLRGGTGGGTDRTRPCGCSNGAPEVRARSGGDGRVGRHLDLPDDVAPDFPERLVVFLRAHAVAPGAHRRRCILAVEDPTLQAASGRPGGSWLLPSRAAGRRRPGRRRSRHPRRRTTASLATARLSLTLPASPIGRAPLSETPRGRNGLRPDRVAALAVEHLAGLQVALGGGDGVGAELSRRPGRLVAQGRGQDADAGLEADHVERAPHRAVPARGGRSGARTARSRHERTRLCALKTTKTP